MGWLNQLPQKIKRAVGGDKKSVPEGVWSKCSSCQSALYHKDLADNAEAVSYTHLDVYKRQLLRE